ncbi:MAG: class I SAM-dependent methyltransferase [Bacteroidota bacterium]|nr:class I SAM-dependent methyltransferase [Bacteroidota bacterium]
MNLDQIQYYKERAQEFEKIYKKKERQKDIQFIGNFLIDICTDKKVFEIACGTGFWTKCMSESASSILATDVNQAVIEIALSKNYKKPVDFCLANVYDLKAIQGNFNLGFGGFIWSHVPRQNLTSFIQELLSKIESGGTVIFIDNRYIEGISSNIESEDENGNTFQIRALENGTTHKILKNFPKDEELYDLIDPLGTDINIIKLDYYWLLSCKKR